MDTRLRGYDGKGGGMMNPPSFLRKQESTPATLNGRNMLQKKQPAVYILASRRYGTLYIGVTSNLVSRIAQHQQDLIPGFTQKYGVHTLVYYELHDTMESALTREKQLKKWKRLWKIRLIEEGNSDWSDLYPSIAE